MRTPFIVGNWKMNLTLHQVESFLDVIKDQMPNPNQVECAIAPSSIYLDKMTRFCKENVGFKTVAQNCFYKDYGAYTGEVSPMAMADMGVSYVMLGHSERRKYFHENDKMINKKVKAVLNNGMHPIICCDETMAKRKTYEQMNWVVNPVIEALKGISSNQARKVVIGYEPSWAIGTGHSARGTEIEEACFLIRETLQDLYGKNIANEIRIVYGGSVNSKNVKDIMCQPNVDGVLPGKSSLDPLEFIKIINYQN
jgi:triosephosphate isomerase (TIM)